MNFLPIKSSFPMGLSVTEHPNEWKDHCCNNNCKNNFQLPHPIVFKKQKDKTFHNKRIKETPIK